MEFGQYSDSLLWTSLICHI